MRPIVIGIAGGSASGKSTVALKIAETFENSSVTIFRADDYYKNQSHLTMDERLLTNYDHPNAFDLDLMVEHFKSLIDYQEVEKPIYDFTVHSRSKEVEIIKPADVLIIEGLFVLEYPEILELLDIKIFVDTDSDIRFIRRLVRDVESRGRTLESVCRQYVEVVRIMHNQFVEPTKKRADLIIPEGGSNYVAIDILCSKIKSHLETRNKEKSNDKNIFN